MGLIPVMKINYTMGHKVHVDIEVRTSAGGITFPVELDDQGWAGNKERQAFLELQTLLEEALELIRHQLG